LVVAPDSGARRKDEAGAVNHQASFGRVGTFVTHVQVLHTVTPGVPDANHGAAQVAIV
jgi:hypothetical protein